MWKPAFRLRASRCCFDGRRLTPPGVADLSAKQTSKETPAGGVVILLPPAVRIARGSLPPLPPMSLLKACDAGLLWRQLFASQAEPLGWRRDSSDICAAFSDLSAAEWRRRVRQAAGWPPNAPVRLFACEQAAAEGALPHLADCIPLDGPPQLFSPLSPGRMRLLLASVAALVLAAVAVGFALWQLPALPLSPSAQREAQDGLALQREQLQALQLRLQRQQQGDSSGHRQRQRVAEASDALYRLAGLLGSARLRRIEMDADNLRLQGVASTLAEMHDLPARWAEQASAGSHYSQLELEQARSIAEAEVSFNLRIRRQLPPAVGPAAP